MALWSLAPVGRLGEPAAARQLPSSWLACSAALWLSAAAELAQVGAQQLPLVLASAGQGVVELCQVVVGSPAGQLDAPGGARGGPAAAQQLLSVQLLASLPLPDGVTQIKHLAEVAAAPAASQLQPDGSVSIEVGAPCQPPCAAWLHCSCMLQRPVPCALHSRPGVCWRHGHGW